MNDSKKVTETMSERGNVSTLVPPTPVGVAAPVVATGLLSLELSVGVFESVGMMTVMLVVVLVVGHGLDGVHRFLARYYRGDSGE